MNDTKQVKTKFKGPGQWRSQAAKLEAEQKSKDTPKKPQK